MPNAISDYGASLFAGLMVGLGTLPADFYVALCTDEPGTGWDGTILETIEPTDPDYVRQPIAKGAPGWALSDNGYVLNANILDFGVPGVSWGVITHYALTDAATAGNLVLYGEYASGAQADGSFDVQIPPGGIVIALANLVASIAS